MISRRLQSLLSALTRPRPRSAATGDSVAPASGSAPGVTEVLEWYLEGALDYSQSLVMPVDTDPFVVGRDKTCALTIASTEVSRRHANFGRRGERLLVSDLGSTNGTFVNRKRITCETEVRDGDVVHLGKVELRVNRRSRTVSMDFAAAPQEDDSTMMIYIKDPNSDLSGKFVACERAFLAMLEHGDIDTAFQPIVTLPDPKVIAYEILGRGVREDLPKTPYQLLGIAEKLKREVQLSEMFRLRGLQLGRLLPGAPLLFVNTHPKERLGEGLRASLEQVRELMPEWRVVLEIHESAVTDLPMMRELKKVLNELHILLAYDDFGAGQARLNELVEVPPDYLKFDVSLIRNIDQASPNKRGMVQKLVDIATELGVPTLAECVETVAEVQVCNEMGFSHAQGFYFGRPATVETFL